MWRDGERRERERKREREREKEGVCCGSQRITYTCSLATCVCLPPPSTHTLSLWVSPGPWRGIVYSVCLAYIFSSFHLRCLNICGSTTLCFLSTSSSTGKISQIHNTSRCIQFMRDILKKKKVAIILEDLYPQICFATSTTRRSLFFSSYFFC